MWRGVAGTPACSPRAGTRPCVCGTWRRWCRIERSAGITEASKPSPFNRRAAGTSSRVAAATAPSRCGTRARADVGRAPRATARTASPHPPRRRCWSARTNPRRRWAAGRRGRGDSHPSPRPPERRAPPPDAPPPPRRHRTRVETRHRETPPGTPQTRAPRRFARRCNAASPQSRSRTTGRCSSPPARRTG